MEGVLKSADVCYDEPERKIITKKNDPKKLLKIKKKKNAHERKSFGR